MYVRKKEPKVISITELFGITILTLTLLALFYPKDKIVHSIASEKSNYDLTLIYLRSIARAYPNDSQNWSRLIQALLKAGHIQEAQTVYEKHLSMHKEEKLIAYNLLKSRYLATHDEKQKQKIATVLKKQMREILQSDNGSLWYLVRLDATSLNFPKIRFEAIRKILLYQIIVKPQEVMDAYNLAIGIGKSKEGLALMENIYQKKHMLSLGMKLAEIYTQQRAYEKAAGLYAKLYTRTNKSSLFFKTVQNYLWAKEKEKALAFLHRYQKHFLGDDAMAQKIIHLYLANGLTKEAGKFSLQVLHHKAIL